MGILVLLAEMGILIVFGSGWIMVSVVKLEMVRLYLDMQNKINIL